MAIYTVHVPDDAPDAISRGERTAFVREGFSVGAMVFGLFYLLWHRLWVAAVVWVLALLALAAFALVFHPPLLALLLLAVLMRLYLGCEGPDLLRWGLARRGILMRDLVSAPGRDEAEALFFGRQPSWAIANVSPPRPAPPAWARTHGTPAVIGVFPDGDGA